MRRRWCLTEWNELGSCLVTSCNGRGTEVPLSAGISTFVESSIREMRTDGSCESHSIPLGIRRFSCGKIWPTDLTSAPSGIHGVKDQAGMLSSWPATKDLDVGHDLPSAGGQLP